MATKKPFLKSAVWPLLTFVLFAVTFAVIFLILKESLLKEYSDSVSQIPSVKRFGSGTVEQIKSYAPTYGALVGVVFGLVQMIFAYILLSIFALIRLTKTSFGPMLAYLLSVLPFMGLAYGILAANRFTAISTGVVVFIGKPLLYSSIGLTTFIFILFVLSYKYAKHVETQPTV